MKIFEEAGFLALVHKYYPTIDCITVYTHASYFRTGNLIERFQKDVLAEYRRQGYKNIILVGVSMGGFGALWLHHFYATDIAGMVVIAPYLGGDFLGDIIASNFRKSLAIDEGDLEFNALAMQMIDQQMPSLTNKMLLAYGQQDRYANNIVQFANKLPASSVIASSGGHGWATWTPIWEIILQQKLLDQFKSAIEYES